MLVYSFFFLTGVYVGQEYKNIISIKRTFDYFIDYFLRNEEENSKWSGRKLFKKILTN